MSDPRLSRLAQLWAQGLEASLSAAEDAELEGLLADAALAEAWAEQQVSREEAPAAGLAMPGRLRSAFQRQFKPWTYWGLRLALPVAAVALWAFWPQAPKRTVLEATSEESSFSEALPSPVDTPVKKREVGPPPGLDQRHHLWVSRQQALLTFESIMPRVGHAELRVFDANGRLVAKRPIALPGRPGTVKVQWDGKSAQGTPAPAGRYRAQVYLDGMMTDERELSIEKK